ncbi:MAG: hypothetical protein RLZZ196_175 [Bacteroidota bacterium]|jgi:hypothetical protein
MNKHAWKDQAACLGMEINTFFEEYEENIPDESGISPREFVDSLCMTCPVLRQCFAVGISHKETGVWGGVYLDNGKISREFGRHRTKADWATTWQTLTMDNE